MEAVLLRVLGGAEKQHVLEQVRQAGEARRVLSIVGGGAERTNDKAVVGVTSDQ
jgi:hypothetical protein